MDLMKKAILFCLIFLLGFIKDSLSEEALPSLAFLQSGFDGLDYKKIESTQYRIFDLSDLSEKVIVNNKTFLCSQYAQFTQIDKREQNSSLGIFSSYNEFFHKLTEDYHVSAGIAIDNVKAGFSYAHGVESIYESLKTQKKSAGISSDIHYMYSLTLAPPFILP
jgi:hypothetical protein